ncbi:MAG: hypothetical protein ABI960_05180 [Candidatus Eisenbacteria bacterium]
MHSAPPHTRTLVDWRAAFIAGVVSGLVLLALEMLLTARAVGSPWVVPRLVAAILLGRGVLPPPATITPGILLAALAIHLPLSIAYACLIAFVLHRWGLAVGIVGGAALGLALYVINFGTTFAIFPWFAPMKSWISLWAHVAFGAVAGGTYELLEVERVAPGGARE